MKRCINPITLKSAKNGIQHVPCGRCLYCLTKRRNDWSFRLNNEYRHAVSAKFITLTYTDENISKNVNQDTGEYIIRQFKSDIQKFMKRLRKAQNSKNQIRYYLVFEFGTTTGRPHFHIILFNADMKSIERLDEGEIWNKGLTHIGEVTPASIHYTTGYIINNNNLEFALMSRRPPIGHHYLVNKDYHVDNWTTCTNVGGHKQPLPRFYSDRMFNKYQRRKINEKLEKDQDQRVAEQQRKNNNYFKQYNDSVHNDMRKARQNKKSQF